MTGDALSAGPGSRPPLTRRVAMALYSDLDHDSRVLHEAASLAAAGHEITVYCLSYDGPPPEQFKVVSHLPDRTRIVPGVASPFRQTGSARLRRIAGRIAWMRDYLRNLRAWGRWAIEAAGAVDVWHAHDLPGLMAVGPLVSDGVAVVYDSHEIFLETGTATRMPWPVRRLLSTYERRLVRRAAALVTVNEAYADVLRRRLAPAAVVIVRNCVPTGAGRSTASTRLRSAAAIPDGAPIVLYHGALTANRGIEQLVAALQEPGMGEVHLALLGFGDVSLLGLPADGPAGHSRVHVLPAVAPDDLVDWVTGADLDAIPLQRSSLNHWLCTPNKLWESIAAGVPVVVSDFPVMRSIVLDDPGGPLGTVCRPDVPASVAAAIRSILELSGPERDEIRDRCRRSAAERWNWETEASRLVALYRTLDGRTGAEPLAR